MVIADPDPVALGVLVVAVVVPGLDVLALVVAHLGSQVFGMRFARRRRGASIEEATRRC